MGLLKKQKLTNGVELNYHRIWNLNITTHDTITIELASYVSEEIRNIEIESNFETYVTRTTYEINYDDNFTISDAYEYLKTLDEFNDAKDV